MCGWQTKCVGSSAGSLYWLWLALPCSRNQGGWVRGGGRRRRAHAHTTPCAPTPEGGEGGYLRGGVGCARLEEVEPRGAARVLGEEQLARCGVGGGAIDPLGGRGVRGARGKLKASGVGGLAGLEAGFVGLRVVVHVGRGASSHAVGLLLAFGGGGADEGEVGRVRVVQHDLKGWVWAGLVWGGGGDEVVVVGWGWGWGWAGGLLTPGSEQGEGEGWVLALRLFSSTSAHSALRNWPDSRSQEPCSNVEGGQKGRTRQGWHAGMREDGRVA